MAYLVIVAAETEPARQKLVAPGITVGRAIDCEVWIDDPRLSRRHCRLEWAGEAWILQDLSSTNGTWVHGSRVARHVLRDGESFQAGSTRFVFHDAEIVHRAYDPVEANRLKRIIPPEASSETLRDLPSHLHGRPIPRPMPRPGDQS